MVKQSCRKTEELTTPTTQVSYRKPESESTKHRTMEEIIADADRLLNEIEKRQGVKIQVTKIEPTHFPTGETTEETTVQRVQKQYGFKESNLRVIAKIAVGAGVVLILAILFIGYRLGLLKLF